MRKSRAESEEICKLTTELLLRWKDVMLGKPSTTTDSAKRPAERDLGKDAAGEEKDPKRRSESKKSDSPATDFEDVRARFLTGDAVRDKCFEMLVAAITVDEGRGEPDELIFSLCRAIEECLFHECGQSTSAAYKSQFRSKYLNLKDAANQPLRHSLLTSALSPARFIAMTPAEMASEERRRQDAQLVERNLREARAAQDNEAETDQFRCGRCRQRRTKYYQLQTRSADEPMTTFVTCINCGNRWKFC